MTRRILVHLNVEVPDDNDRDAEEIGDEIVSYVYRYTDGPTLDMSSALNNCVVTNALSEELEATS